MESIPQFKANALDRLVAAGTIGEIDREHVNFIVRTIVHPPERPGDPLPENAVGGTSSSGIGAAVRTVCF